jgi:hypothetical protein
MLHLSKESHILVILLQKSLIGILGLEVTHFLIKNLNVEYCILRYWLLQHLVTLSYGQTK